MRKLKRWIVPIFIGIGAGFFLFATEAGKKLTSKIPFFGKKGAED